MSQMVLFREITKRFGDVQAVKGVTLAVEQGEFVSLLGPSGCGKTTLLRTCAGLETPDAGQVYLEGVDVTGVPPFKRAVNMVFQRWALFPHKTVAENVAFGLELKKLPRTEINRQVRSMLELVKMEGYQARYPKQLSGGQAQRVALARALALQPKVLLLDEPLGSLDLKLRKEMQIELINIQKRLSMTFIYVTHDQEEALTMSHRVVIMNAGSIVQDGTPTEIYQRPNSVFAAHFIGETVFFTGNVVSLDGPLCRVDTGNFTLYGVAPQGLRAGQRVTVCVRPERVRINCLSGRGCDNSIEGEVVNTIFKGPVVHYQMLLPGGQVITVQQNLEQDVPLYNAQSVLHLDWAAENAIVLAD